jgi:hypothetical protein
MLSHAMKVIGDAYMHYLLSIALLDRMPIILYHSCVGNSLTIEAFDEVCNKLAVGLLLKATKDPIIICSYH